MSKPTKETKTYAYISNEFKLFYELSKLKSAESIKKFLKELLTPSEFLMIKRRWHIACLLMQNLDIRTVAKEANVSTQTVVSVKKVLQNGTSLKKAAKLSDSRTADSLPDSTPKSTLLQA